MPFYFHSFQKLNFSAPFGIYCVDNSKRGVKDGQMAEKLENKHTAGGL
jgi:hypothetical protein